MDVLYLKLDLVKLARQSIYWEEPLYNKQDISPSSVLPSLKATRFMFRVLQFFQSLIKLSVNV